MADSLVSIQIIPKPKDGEDSIPLVDAAIAVIDASGLRYQVHPLETTIEGNMAEIFSVVEKMNDKMIELGSRNVISQIKVLYQPDGVTMDTLTEKYR